MKEMIAEIAEAMAGMLAETEQLPRKVPPRPPPSPPTQSPVTYAGLLPAVQGDGQDKRLEMIVMSLLEHRSEMEALDIDRERIDGGGLRRPPGEKGRTEGTICGVVMLAAGTDTLGYRLPPNGRGGFSIPIGTDVRGYRRPPDLGLDRQLGWTGRWSLRIRSGSFVAGTSKQHFHCPPDPLQGEIMLRQMASDLAGTEM